MENKREGVLYKKLLLNILEDINTRGLLPIKKDC